MALLPLRISLATNGHIALLDLVMSTPTTAAESKVPNHVMLTCSTGVGMDERGLAVQLHDIEQVDLDIQPADDAEAVTHLKTQFAPDETGQARRLAFRSVENGEVTRAWSETWPDEAEVHVEKEGRSGHLMSTWIEGAGGHMDTCTKHTGTVPLAFPCWTLHARFPVRWAFVPDGQATVILQAPDGVRSTVLIEEVGEAIGSWACSVGNGIGKGLVEFSMEFTSSGANLLDSMRGLMQDGCELMYDLDGVGAWDGESPFFAEGTGSLDFEHSSRASKLQLSAGVGEFYGTSVWLDTVTKRDPDDRNITWEEKVYKRGGGHEHASSPSAYMQVYHDNRYKRFTVDSCVWTEEGCD